MAGKVDKRTSNFIIAGGYCLVAVIILVNYLGQPSLRPRSKASADQAAARADSSAAAPASDQIQRQLEEQKRVNQEMREMLRRLQEGYKGRRIAGGKAATKVPVNGFDIPELDDSVIKALMSKNTNPFIKGRNPFMPSPSSGSGLSSDGAVGPLKADDNLPFIISGADSAARFISNY